MWTGLYVGGNLGVAWGRAKTTTTVDCNVPAFPFPYICNNAGVGAADAAAIDAAGTSTDNDTAFTGGIQAGYNYQWARAILGIEVDVESFNLGGTHNGSDVFPVMTAGFVGAGRAFAVSTTYDTDWLWTLRGRLGWLVRDDLLLYATGGAAFTKLDVSFAYSDQDGATGSGSASSRRTGWTVGGGIEWALNDHWSVKGEYLYLDFGSVTATGVINGAGPALGKSQGISTKVDLTAQIARFGVNYRF